MRTREFIRATNDADQILAVFRVYKPPVPIAVIKKIFKQCTIDKRDFHEDAYGFSFPDEEKALWRVLINSKYSFQIQRFTAFHELFHMLQNKPGYCRTTSAGDLEERLANHFAESMLMPAKWIKKYWRRFHNIYALAIIFDVTPEMVESRLKALNLWYLQVA